jgi:hypothetical protein
VVLAQPAGDVYVIPHVPEISPVNNPVPLIVLPAQQDQTPPDGELKSVVLLPSHTERVPEIDVGAAFTVTVADVEQEPDPQMMIAVPGAIPVTMPDELTVATAGDIEVHVTPDVAELSVVVCPSQKDNVPVIAAGLAFTVSMAVARHPVGNV